MKNHRYDICFFGLKCFDLLVNAETPKYLGGIERNLVNLAQGLANSNSNLRIAFITFDEGQPECIQENGIDIYKSYSADEGIRGIRFVHPRMTRIWSLMKEINAKHYLCMGAGIEAWTIAIGCRYFLKNSESIFCIASDDDTKAFPDALTLWLERKAYLASLPIFKTVISQTKKQQTELHQHHNVDSIVIPMPRTQVTLSANPDQAPAANLLKQDRISIMWIGRWVQVKRLEWLMELAPLLPEMDFHIIGSSNQGSSTYTQGLEKKASDLPNVYTHKKVKESELAVFYHSCHCLLNTSILEGFPTTFLEAWSVGLPCITTFDPDNIVSEKKVGYVASTIPELKSYLLYLADPKNKAEYDKISTRAKTLFENEFSMSSIIPTYEKILV